MLSRVVRAVLLIVAVAFAGVLVAHAYGFLDPVYESLGWHGLMNHSGATAAGGTAEVWTCPMHPQIRSDRPGTCPICNMDLVRVKNGGGGAEASSIGGYAKVTISPEQQQLIGVRTARVKRGKLVMAIRAV